MADHRIRFWHPVEDVRLHPPKSVLWIEGRGFCEVQVCGLHEVLVRRLAFKEAVRRVGLVEVMKRNLLDWFRSRVPGAR